MSNEENTTVGPNSKTTIGVLAGGILLCATVGATAANAFYGLKAELREGRISDQARMEKMEERLTEIKASTAGDGNTQMRLSGVESAIRELKNSIDGGISMNQLEGLARALAFENPGMKVPNPRDPTRSFTFPKTGPTPP